MNHGLPTVEVALSGLQQRLGAMNSAQLGRVAELARAGRTAVWNLRKGKSGARPETVLRIEQAVAAIEAEDASPTHTPGAQAGA